MEPTAATRKAAQPVHDAPGAPSSEARIASFETKPSIGGMPAIDAHPSAITAKLKGIRLYSPGGKRRRSRVSVA